jgi:hypothetical protein
MATTTVDITLAARAARHLYVTSGIIGIWIVSVLTIVFPIVAIVNIRFSIDFFRQNWDAVLLYMLSLSLLVIVLFAVYYARKELNGWAFIVAGFGAVLELAMVVGVVIVGIEGGDGDLSPTAARITAAIFAFAAIYFVRVLVDFCRLGLSRYSSLGRTVLGVANAVSTLCRTTRSPIPVLHWPTDPVATCIYATLFIASAPLLFLIGYVLQFLPFNLAVLGFLIWLGSMARRHYVFRADKVLNLDDRAPVIFLRSFGDDKVRLWGRGWYGKFRRRTFDEAVMGFAQRVGPFVAVANPRTKLPRLGAAQSHLPDSTWQEAIARWVAMAQMIVMVAGRTEGIRWELDHIFTNEGHTKLVILFPPALRKKPAAARQWLNEHFSNTRYAADLAAIDSKRTIAIAFLDNGLLNIETRRIHRHEVDYLTAFQVLIYCVLVRTDRDALKSA